MTTALEKEITPLEPDSQPAPRIIPRSAHPISRKDIDREALKVLYRLRDAGYTAYLVGGSVRDLYLGKTPKDFDISTNARPGQLRKLFKNSRLIGRRFRLVQVFFRGGKIIEVSTFRCRNAYDINGKVEVLPSNNTFGSPVDDAFRRDLTINALFYEINDFSIIDYAGGVDDLNRRTIRIIGDPDQRLTRDPARMLRVIRHAARNNFTIDDDTWRATKEHRRELNLCPISRVRDELMKDLRSGASRPWAQLAIDSGLFNVLFPFYEKLLEGAPPPSPRQLLFEILEVVDRLRERKKIALPDHIMLALIMLPWAAVEMNLLKLQLKAGEAFRLSKKIRARLDEILEYLGIKRGTREAISTLLANITIFLRYDQAEGLPKWLKKKSYYKECLLFYQIYREAQGGEPVDLSNMAVDAVLSSKPRSRPGKTYRRGGGRGPAFAKKRRDGVFGFKKK